MSFNKKLLVLAIAGGLLSTAAQAVDISAGDDPVRLATEVNIGANGTVFTNTGALDISSTFDYNFSNGEVRYARVECSSNIEFETAAVTLSGAGTVGAVNGVGTNAINFSVTAVGAFPISSDTLTVDGNRRVLAQGPVNCSYSLYDQPSQAAAGGPAGLIVSTSGAYISFATSYLYSITPNTSTANVEAVPSFSRFVNTAPTNSTALAQLAQFSFNNRSAIAGGGAQPIKANGTPSTTVDILAATTSHFLEGDFSAAANADGTYTGAALSRVFVSGAADCSVVAAPATALTATAARFQTGPGTFAGVYLCYAPRVGNLIPASAYTFRLAPVSNAGFTGGTLGPSASGTIVRNGTELQAPLAQIPGGFISRLVLTNTGSVDRPYTATILREAGNTGTPGSAVTGTVPANGTLVVDMANVLGTFTTGQPRGTVNVTVAGPNSQIQGLYQIVKPDTGSISNHVMVRPGTN